MSQENFVEKLLSISSRSLGSNSLSSNEFLHSYGDLGLQLEQLLYSQKNGFYAFEGALHVRSTDVSVEETDLKKWNSVGLWRGEYAKVKDDTLFFAEDIFGCQFCVFDNAICTFDPEVGDFEFLAKDIEAWARLILSDYNTLTGYPLANRWQHQNGMLKRNFRLLPKVPFVGGGEFTIENLYACDAVEGMRVRASFAKAISGLPDGARIHYVVKNV